MLTRRLRMSTRPRGTATQDVIYRVACGQVSALNGTEPPVWSADSGFSGNTNTVSVNHSIDRTGVIKPAPQAVYQYKRWATGPLAYTFGGLTANTAYRFRLHFAEVYYSSAGGRVMNATLNGTTVLSGFDIFAEAGGQNKATVRDVTGIANASGQVVLTLTATSASNDPKICGIEISGNVAHDDTPINVTVQPYSNYVLLDWDAPMFASGPVTGYNVYQNGAKLTASPVTATGFRPGQDSPALSPSTQYTFKIATVINGVESNQSVTRNATTSAIVTLLFEDTFSGSSLDLNKWVVESAPAGATNEEVQRYVGDLAPFSLANNTLTISASRDGNGNWVSGRIHVKEQYALLYGKLEAELRLPSIKGAWPAFWTWAVYGGGWPGGGEIDVVEAVNNESIIYANLHYSQNGGHGQSGPHATPIDITQWHTYAADVRPGYVQFYIDNQPTVRWTQSQIQSSGGNWPFGTVKQGTILNLAIGGLWPRTVPDASVSLIQMHVRNVRIYP